MEICLIYGETANEFDIPLNVSISYINDLCLKIFPLQSKKFNIIYNEQNLSELDKETPIQEIFDNNINTPILIYIVPNENEEIENNILSEKDYNYFRLMKEKFENFNKDFNQSNQEIQQFEKIYKSKSQKLASLFKDFEENTFEINYKINRYYNINHYNFCVQFFQQNQEHLKINEYNLKNVNKHLENCINNYKIIENQIIFQNKIIEFLNNYIEKFQNIKICFEEIKKNNIFNHIIQNLDLLYSILLEPYTRKKIQIKTNKKKTFSDYSIDRYKEEILPLLDNPIKNQINNSIGVDNILLKYQSNDKVFQKFRNKSNNLSNKTEFNSSKKINSNYFMNHYSNTKRNKNIRNFNKILEKYNLKLSSNYMENPNQSNLNLKKDYETIDNNDNINILNNNSNSSRAVSIKENRDENNGFIENYNNEMNKKKETEQRNSINDSNENLEMNENYGKEEKYNLTENDKLNKEKSLEKNKKIFDDSQKKSVKGNNENKTKKNKKVNLI